MSAPSTPVAKETATKRKQAEEEILGTEDEEEEHDDFDDRSSSAAAKIANSRIGKKLWEMANDVKCSSVYWSEDGNDIFVRKNQAENIQKNFEKKAGEYGILIYEADEHPNRLICSHDFLKEGIKISSHLKKNWLDKSNHRNKKQKTTSETMHPPPTTHRARKPNVRLNDKNDSEGNDSKKDDTDIDDDDDVDNKTTINQDLDADQLHILEQLRYYSGSRVSKKISMQIKIESIKHYTAYAYSVYFNISYDSLLNEYVYETRNKYVLVLIHDVVIDSKLGFLDKLRIISGLLDTFQAAPTFDNQSVQ